MSTYGFYTASWENWKHLALTRHTELAEAYHSLSLGVEFVHRASIKQSWLQRLYLMSSWQWHGKTKDSCCPLLRCSTELKRQNSAPSFWRLQTMFYLHMDATEPAVMVRQRQEGQHNTKEIRWGHVLYVSVFILIFQNKSGCQVRMHQMRVSNMNMEL